MKKIFSLVVIASFFICSKSFAQLTLSNDTTICAGQSVQLSVSGGTTYTWTNANTLSSATSANPVATPSQTTTYIVSSPLSSANLVINPDFSQGNTGFTSSYFYELPTNLLGAGSYFVGGSATHWNQGMQGCGDHTTGADTNMLIANGILTSQTPVWCSTFNVSPNSTYNLSGYFTYFTQTNIPSMRWMVNGTPIGTTTNAALFACLWRNFTATWNSGNNTTATFCIYDPNITENGNDFALDDISITGSGTMYDTVTVTVVNPPLVNLGNDISICGSTNILLDAQNPGSNYLWNDNSIQQTLSVNAAGTYSVTVTNTNMCSASSDIVINTSSITSPAVLASNQQICASDTAQLCVNGVFATYLWNTGAITNCINTSLAGNYYLTVTDANGCTAESSRLAISVYPSPTVSISVNGDTLSSYNAVSYQWFLNSNPILNATANVYVAEQSGSYSVLVTDSNGCEATSTSIQVVTGINDMSVNDLISVYPNPNSIGNWELMVDDKLVGSGIELTDVNGKLVFKSEIRNPKSEIKPASEIASGVYWLKIVSAQKNYSLKLIKL